MSGIKTCKKCGYFYPDTESTCPTCGARNWSFFGLGGSKGPLIPCKACGQLISKNASKCPHCGEPNTRLRPRHVAAIFMVAFIVLVVLINVAKDNEPAEKPTEHERFTEQIRKQKAASKKTLLPKSKWLKPGSMATVIKAHDLQHKSGVVLDFSGPNDPKAASPKVKPGDKVAVLKAHLTDWPELWYQVRAGNDEGWVPASSLQHGK